MTNLNSLTPSTYDNGKTVCFNAHQGLENTSFIAIEKIGGSKYFALVTQLPLIFLFISFFIGLRFQCS